MASGARLRPPPKPRPLRLPPPPGAATSWFSSLAGTAETNTTLEKIVEKLDALIAATEVDGASPAANDA